MNDVRGLIFDMQGFSVHDGPGSRTTVFLSGCPLRCTWCANPEGRELRRQILFSSQKCKYPKEGCQRCIKACKRYAIVIHDGEIQRNDEICKHCDSYECTKACYQEALRLSGKFYTVEEVMAVLKRDRQFWENGGVTFSGGDPLFQKEFLIAVLKRCKEEGIHTVIETSGYANISDFLEIMSYINLAFIDLKQMDDQRHREQTGVSNRLILENIAKLVTSSWNGRLILRMPVILEYNDSRKHIEAVIAYMNANGLFEINILPFHRMGTTKWTQLGESYPFKDCLPTEAEILKNIQQQFLCCDIACYIGNEVIY